MHQTTTRRRQSMRLATLAVVALVLFAALAVGCGPGDASQGFLPIYRMDRVKLDAGDKEYLLAATEALLTHRPLPDPSGHPALTENEVRGVFLSYAVPQSRALVSFSLGDSVVEALETAAARLLEKVGVEVDPNQGVLKIDLVDGSGTAKSLKLDEKQDWRRERTLLGMLFDTKPAIALLPDELAGWNLISDSGKFQPNNSSRYLKFQSRGKILVDRLKAGQTIDYTTFPTISFGRVDGEAVDFYRGKAVRDDLTADDYYNAALLAGAQLERFVHANGKFSYVYKPWLDRDSGSYNELRHCGTTYAMLEVYEFTRDPELLDAIKNAMEYMLKRLDGPNPKDTDVDWLAIRGIGRDSKGRKVPEAKLGGAGLCLLMLTKYDAVTGDTGYRDTMTKLARFIRFMQDEDGSFRSKYFYAPSDKTFNSLYYPGEAMLAMVRFYQLTGEPWLLEVATRGMDYIALVRDIDRTSKNVEHDHWVMIAINELYRLAPRQHYLMHLKKIAAGIRLKQKLTHRKYPDYVGSFYATPRSTPAGTRNEGLIAGYNLLTYLEDPEAEQWLPMIDLTAKFQLKCQFTEENSVYVRNPKRVFGGFKEGLNNYEMRIDYSQHNISSLLGYYRILSGNKYVPLSPPETVRASEPAAAAVETSPN